MNRVLDLLFRLSGSWLVVVGALVASVGGYSVLIALRRQFEQAAGMPPFDFSGPLTVAELYTQLPSYTQAAKGAYRLFFLADLFVPPILGLFCVLLAAAVLRGNSGPLARILLGINVVALSFSPVLVDWGENIGFLLTIEQYPRVVPLVATIAVTFNALRISTLPFTFSILLITLVLGGIFRLQRVLRPAIKP